MAEIELQALLAECALQMIVQREHLMAPDGTNLLAAYISKEISLNGYEFLVDALLPDKGAAISYVAQNPELFLTKYVYMECIFPVGTKAAGKRPAPIIHRQLLPGRWWST